MRELSTTQYSAQAFSDENLLLNFKLLDPVQLSKNLTWLWGRESDEFPLTFLTEGNGAIKSKKVALNDTQYKWPVMGRTRNTSLCLGIANTNITTPGVSGSAFEADFEDNWLIPNYIVFTPDAKNQCRVQGEPTKLANNRYRYQFIIMTGDKTQYVALANFNNKYWAMGSPVTTPSKGDGNRSNKMAPGEMTNQFGFHRYSYEIAGNVSNKATNIEFDVEGGGKTNKWVPFDFKIWELDRKRRNEEDLWYSVYNRTSTGELFNTDFVNGELLPKGAGIKNILTATGQYDTYSTLTLKKFNSTVRSVFGNRTDSTGPMEIVLYTGKGGAEAFHNAITADVGSSQYVQALGEKVIMGTDSLEYGAYFNRYKTIEGYVITVKTMKIFDFGSIADMQRKNGDLIDGYPRESYNMVFLDQSMTMDGERNVMMVCEEGREVVHGIYKGMSDIPPVWGAVPGNQLSDRRDIATYELIDSQGIALKNWTTSFWLEMA